MPALLCCRDPLNPRAVDEHFAAEAAAARDAGVAVARIDHDALLAGDAAAAVRPVPAGLGPAWYRGWMIPAHRYAELDTALRSKGASLVVPPQRYRAAHELPGWYPVFADRTPVSVWQPGVPDAAAVAALAERLPDGPVFVKDYVKSRKHDWHTACYAPDRAALPGVVAEFVRLQDDFLAGGVVLRAFESLTGAEARVWWLDGEPVLTGAHPDTPRDTPQVDLTGIGAAVRELGCRFVTTDLARHTDGRWRVVEVGDGQVSDLPAGSPPGAVVTALAAAAETVAR